MTAIHPSENKAIETSYFLDRDRRLTLHNDAGVIEPKLQVYHFVWLSPKLRVPQLTNNVFSSFLDFFMLSPFPVLSPAR